MRPYKVLCDSSHPDWKKLRHERVTATEVYSLLNESRAPGKKWPKTRGELLEEKRQDAPPEWADTRRMWHGRHAEDYNRTVFSSITGIRSRATHVFLESSLVKGLACTLDALIVAPSGQREVVTVATSRGWPQDIQNEVRMRGGVGILEMKQTDDFFGKEWKVGVPEHYKMQVWAQLVVTGLRYAVIACKIGAADMEAHIIDHPGDVFVKTLQEEMAVFMKERTYG